MKKLISYILFCVLVTTVSANDTVWVKEAQVPVLIDRMDNVLFRLRIDAEQNQVLDKISMKFGKDVDLSEIKSVKVYYSGTDAIQRKGQMHFAPYEYIPRDEPGKTLAANASYSVLKDQVQGPGSETTFKCKQSLFPGINYFWISLEMKPTASVKSKISAEITSVVTDNRPMIIENVVKAPYHLLGLGVRHAGDDGVNAYRIPGLATSNKGTLFGIYDIRYNSSMDLQEYVDIGLSRSTDGGQNWEDMRVILSFGEEGGLPKAQNGVGDPAILVDKTTGTIWVIAAWTHGMGYGRAWFNSGQGMDHDHTAQLVLVKSDDDGKTWSEPINVTSQLKDPSWYFLLQGPGNGITMKDGDRKSVV
jgi:sialidase-1